MIDFEKHLQPGSAPGRVAFPFKRIPVTTLLTFPSAPWCTASWSVGILSIQFTRNARPAPNRSVDAQPSLAGQWEPSARSWSQCRSDGHDAFRSDI